MSQQWHSQTYQYLRASPNKSPLKKMPCRYPLSGPSVYDIRFWLFTYRSPVRVNCCSTRGNDHSSSLVGRALSTFPALPEMPCHAMFLDPFGTYQMQLDRYMRLKPHWAFCRHTRGALLQSSATRDFRKSSSPRYRHKSRWNERQALKLQLILDRSVRRRTLHLLMDRKRLDPRI